MYKNINNLLLAIFCHFQPLNRKSSTFVCLRTSCLYIALFWLVSASGVSNVTPQKILWFLPPPLFLIIYYLSTPTTQKYSVRVNERTGGFGCIHQLFKNNTPPVCFGCRVLSTENGSTAPMSVNPLSSEQKKIQTYFNFIYILIVFHCGVNVPFTGTKHLCNKAGAIPNTLILLIMSLTAFSSLSSNV